MSYLLDRKLKRKKIFSSVFLIFILIVFFYFRSGIFNKISILNSKVFYPILATGKYFQDNVSSIYAYFSFKKSLIKENENLKSELLVNNALMLNYNTILSENADLKEILNRKNEKKNMVLSAVLLKPNQSLYDTLIIDVGVKNNIKEGDYVFAYGNIPIGRVATVYDNFSKVVLFSSSGEKTEVVISLGQNPVSGSNKNIFMDLVGRGGGNFEMVLPRDFTLTKDDKVVLPGISSYVVASVESTISDPRDPFMKALLVSPVNIQDLKFVEVEE